MNAYPTEAQVVALLQNAHPTAVSALNRYAYFICWTSLAVVQYAVERREFTWRELFDCPAQALAVFENYFEQAVELS